jgi:hypothetical protein
MANFQDILNKPMDEIDAPVPLPVGTYLCLVDGVPEVSQKGKNQNTAVTFNLKFMQPQADVDQSALISALKGKTLPDRSIRHNLWVTEDAAWRLKQFLKDHLAVEAKSMSEAIAQAQGRQVYVTLGHRPSDDGTQIYMDIKSTAKV